MKSAAFNLAFKVHRDEVTFNEGLVQAHEEGASEDFLDALNSLAGEVRYNKADVNTLLDAAASGQGQPEEKGPEEKAKEAIGKLQSDIDALEEKYDRNKDGLTALVSVLNAPDQLAIPGINSILLLMVGGVIVAALVSFKVMFAISGFVGLIGLVGAGLLLYRDTQIINAQKRALAIRRQQVQDKIDVIEKSLAAIEAKMDKKRENLKEIAEAAGLDEEVPD